MLDYEPGSIPALELGSKLEYKPGSLLPSGSILEQEQGRVQVQLQILKGTYYAFSTSMTYKRCYND